MNTETKVTYGVSLVDENGKRVMNLGKQEDFTVAGAKRFADLQNKLYPNMSSHYEAVKITTVIESVE